MIMIMKNKKLIIKKLIIKKLKIKKLKIKKLILFKMLITYRQIKKIKKTLVNNVMLLINFKINC
jgi:hypothetical protein